MWCAKARLYRLLTSGLLVATLVAGAIGSGKVHAKGRTLPFLYNEQGSYQLVSAAGTFHIIGVGAAKIPGFPQGTDRYSAVLYPPAANGCQTVAVAGTVTFANSQDSYDYVDISQLCPVAGHPTTQASGSGTFSLTRGFGMFKGAGGGGTFNITGTLLPTKPGQLPRVKYTIVGTSGSVTLTS
ncbi:MAG: hypothetical protein JWO42_702 [Chloroflexi bacterium]|nr:hypothetical protein [Chloroflexota bacterium]